MSIHPRLTFRVSAPLVALLALSVVSAACPPKHPDPLANAAQNAREIVLRLGELQSAAIAANEASPQALNDAAAIKLVKFTTAAVRTVQQTPYGWGPSVKTAWADIKAEFGGHPRIAPFVPIIDLILRGV